jgi:predicted NBD/HSP70 family sugar kinase
LTRLGHPLAELVEVVAGVEQAAVIDGQITRRAAHFHGELTHSPHTRHSKECWFNG